MKLLQIFHCICEIILDYLTSLDHTGTSQSSSLHGSESLALAVTYSALSTLSGFGRYSLRL